jgi:molybdopterin synthase sulfur carrier subunit
MTIQGESRACAGFRDLTFYPAFVAATVRLFAAARSAAGTGAADVAAGNLNEVLLELTGRFPGVMTVLPRCSFLVNGVAVHGNHADIVIGDGDEVDVLPPFAGG